MPNEPNDGGPAFPTAEPNNYYPGMSLRAHFAGLAMQAAMHPATIAALVVEGGADCVEGVVADTAVDMADALIARLEKRDA